MVNEGAEGEKKKSKGINRMPDTRVLPKISCVSFSCPCGVKFTWWIYTNYVCFSLQLLNLLIVFTVLISLLFLYLVWPGSLHFKHCEFQITDTKTPNINCFLCIFHVVFKKHQKTHFLEISHHLNPTCSIACTVHIQLFLWFPSSQPSTIPHTTLWLHFFIFFQDPLRMKEKKYIV